MFPGRFLPSGNQGVTNVVWCDIYDNIVPLTASSYFVYADPAPLGPRKKPPVLHDRVKTESKTATVYISDVYRGRAMAGVPRGEAKALRVFMSEYSPAIREATMPWAWKATGT